MSQPLKAPLAPQTLIGVPLSTPPKGSITITISQDLQSLTLSGGNLAELGWLASGTTITLSPVSNQMQPVLYRFDFQFALDERFMLLADAGIQISASSSTAPFAVCSVSMPLHLINNVTSGSETINLGFLVVDTEDNNTVLSFGDPTIVFDPPQT